MSPTATATPGTSKVARKALQKLRWGYKKSSPRVSKKSLKSSSGSSNSDKENQIPGTSELASKISTMTPKSSPGISKKTPKSSSRTPKRILRSTSGSSNSDKENQIHETSGLASKISNMSPKPETSKMASKISSVSSDSDKENQPGTSGMSPQNSPKILKMSPNGTLRISEMSPKNSPRTPKMGPKSRVFKSSSDLSDSDKENSQLASPVVVKIAKLQNLPRNSQEFSFRVGPNAKQSYGRKLLCEMCNFSTDSQMSLKNHRALTCSDSVFTKFQCDFCPFQSQATRMIRSHIERDHSTIPKPSARLNSKHFHKTSSEEEEGSLYSDN